MKKKIVFGIIIIIIIILISLMSVTNKKTTVEDNTITNELSSTETQVQQTDEINNLKNELGITGNTELYVVNEEYDGRRTLAIKPDLQYNVVMAGILKGSMPEYENVNDILKDEPESKGIWVSENSRDKTLEILETITKAKYLIDENGYLQQEEKNEMNEYDQIINKILSSNKLYVIDINSICYILDNVTGEIVENQFEEIDPYMPFEYFEAGDKSIFVITTNSKNKLSYEDIFKEILENINS